MLYTAGAVFILKSIGLFKLRKESECVSQDIFDISMIITASYNNLFRDDDTLNIK